MPLPEKQYLGDAVYVSTDGYYLTLTTEDGVSESNRIMLEPPVYQSLLAFAKLMEKSVLEDFCKAEKGTT